MRLTLRKEEKLRHKRLVEDLFNSGESFYDYPLRMVWRRLSDEELDASFRAARPERIGPVQMLITIPKRKIRHAVDRVLMRRRIREAYRLHRLPLKNSLISESSSYAGSSAESTPQSGTLSIAFIYIADKTLPYSLIEEKMQRLLAKLFRNLEKAK